MSFEKVFEIAPIFRAEPSRTNRHLSEAISIDFEEAYVDYNDVMDRIEDLVNACITTVQQFVKEGHLRWDSLGEYLATAISFQVKDL